MQNITLTDEERKLALGYASDLEKSARRWRTLRWIAVVCLVSAVALMFMANHLAETLRDTLELPPGTLRIPDATGSEAVEKSLQVMTDYTDARITMLRFETLLTMKVLIFLGSSTFLFVHAVNKCRGDRRDRLLARLLRAVASE